MNRPTFFLIAGLLLISAGTAFAGTTTLTTYYPAPAGNYQQLRLVPEAAPATPCATGTLYVDLSGTLQYCNNSNGDLTGTWGYADVWAQSGSNIYPADNAMNVGIGKTDPGYKLDITGSGAANDRVDLNVSGRIRTGMPGPSGTMTGSGGVWVGTDQFFGSMDAAHLGLWNTNWRLSIDQAGHVGIGGILAPFYPLDVAQTDISYPAINVDQISAATRRASLGFGLSSSLNSGWIMGQSFWNNGVSDFFLWDVTAGAARLYVNTNGNVGIGNTNPSYKLDVSGDIRTTGNVMGSAFLYNSDKRLKKDVAPLDHALDKVCRLKGVSFRWKKNNVKDIGVIAQNVEKVLPELVQTGADGMKSVEYGNLTALLIEAVKEQQKQIENLKKQVAKLQK